MKYKKNIYILILIFLFLSCNDSDSSGKIIKTGSILINKDSLSFNTEVKIPEAKLLDTITCDFEDIDLVDITLFSKDIILDISYATKNNFLDTVLYPCAKCLLRYEVLKDLLKVETEFKSMGYRLKVFDCYRPHSVQVIMWNKVPMVGLVADPKTGSRHNRGSAVDLTLCDLAGNEIDMGTDHDDLSLKGRTFYTGFSDTVYQNRMLLRTVMQKYHFIGINSEWWHFSHDCATKYKVSDLAFECE